MGTESIQENKRHTHHRSAQRRRSNISVDSTDVGLKWNPDNLTFLQNTKATQLREARLMLRDPHFTVEIRYIKATSYHQKGMSHQRIIGDFDEL